MTDASLPLRLAREAHGSASLRVEPEVGTLRLVVLAARAAEHAAGLGVAHAALGAKAGRLFATRHRYTASSRYTYPPALRATRCARSRGY